MTIIRQKNHQTLPSFSIKTPEPFFRHNLKCYMHKLCKYIQDDGKISGKNKRENYVPRKKKNIRYRKLKFTYLVGNTGVSLGAKSE